MIVVRPHTPDFLDDVEAFARQMPFAVAQALRGVGEDAVLDLEESLRQHFTIRSDWVEKGIRWAGPDRRRRYVPKGNPTIYVGSVDDFMRLQALGGTKRAGESGRGRRRGKRGDGHSLGVPSKEMRSRSKRGGQLSRGQWPGRLLARADKSRTRRAPRRKGRRRAPLPFVMKTSRGPVVAQRVSKSSDEVVILYSLRRTVRVKKRWPFKRIVRDAVKRTWRVNMERGIRRALATRRRA